ncbi:hypothetical protein TNCV_4150081 [Trichonephila clavipes]|uniref:Uncharacterized protein n=1 Tax=Trichonephila clavipes TaxID=2585209 RepID=A0A8X7BFK2_TRICX|nr:hypothetical protein TNCV_4150081 [Trichonephila clavipes]
MNPASNCVLTIIEDMSGDPAFTIARPICPQPGVMVWGAISFDSRTLLVVIQAHLQHSAKDSSYAKRNNNFLTDARSQLLSPEKNNSQTFFSSPNPNLFLQAEIVWLAMRQSAEAHLALSPWIAAARYYLAIESCKYILFDVRSIHCDIRVMVLDESRSFFRVHTGYFSNIPKCIKAEFIASWGCSQSSVVSSSQR